MITKEQSAELLRLYHAEKWKIGTIAAQLGIHHGTVRRVLARAGVTPLSRAHRPSIADPYVTLIVETLAQYPKLPASRLYVMAKERGYRGGPDHFRRVVGRHRPRPAAEAYLRLRTLPGEQAQVDWAHFGTLTVGRATRQLMAFVMVLSFSRMVFVRFYLNATMPSFLHGHVSAFDFWGGVPRVLLYEYVPRNIFVLMCPLGICDRGIVYRRRALDGEKRRTHMPIAPAIVDGRSAIRN